ncbi:MAG: cobalamin biosynthesis protein P47K [Planctomycetes bacterium]|nr:cobalamin biosynthesis protein P47K [Planctomycetota bacterium]
MSHQASNSERARYIMIGGFLGAGKTTAVARLARRLAEQGRRVGLIANDQSDGLVDTALLRSKGFSVEEIAGGCFCCRFNSLLEAAQRLTRQTRPDVFVAEPVGSCTDLVATVSYPLRRMYGDRYSIAPLSVLVDPLRAARILGLEKGRAFSDKVIYVYRKQLEEADAIFINKCDLAGDPLRERLEAAIGEAFPRAEVFCGSARDGTGLDPWFSFILDSEGREGADLEIEYDLYAEGEAQLGWLNATVRLQASRPFDGNDLLLRLARSIRDAVASRGAEIAHLKMTLDTEEEDGILSAVSLVGSEEEPDLRESLLEQAEGGVLIVNLRAEADPELLKEVTDAELSALEAEGVRASVEHMERFRPARPVPTHRMIGGAP